jgi:hypothetical protein
MTLTIQVAWLSATIIASLIGTAVALAVIPSARPSHVRPPSLDPVMRRVKP